MRILKFFIVTSVIILVLGGLALLLGREIVLFLGSSMLASDYKKLNSKSYIEKCSTQYGYSQESWTQIRFTSNKDYNLEVVCEDFIATPIILETKKLPPLLFKSSTGSGFIIDERELPYWIEFKALGRSLFVYVEENQIHSNYLRKADLDYEAGPISSCQAHSFTCCDVEVQSGIGEQLTGVNDCPKSCYQSCLLRPVILSLNSRPAMDSETRTVTVRNNEATTFSYVIGDGKTDVFAGQIIEADELNFLERLQAVFSGESNSSIKGLALPVTVNLDFGDGEVWQSNNLKDTTDHQFSCKTRICFFQVKLSASDASGVLSVDNELAKMVVRVER